MQQVQDIHSEEKSNELEKLMALNYVILQSHTHSSINTEMIKICTFCN